METVETETPIIPIEEIQEANKTESAENFQKFIYELFDKNGILNDLRAYLRGHIIEVLKNSQTGDPPACQKHFTQRLEPKFQALNMLIAEYFLCMEFSYSLSVFVSEIPLANMVFGFAKSLMNIGTDGEVSGLRFKENDVWSILNSLGVKCDSEHANKIVEMYKTHNDSSLLFCILKCVQLCTNTEPIYSAQSQEDSISSSSKTSEHESRPRMHARDKCRHYTHCRACHARFSRLREKYRKKKKHYSNNAKEPSVNPLNVESFMKKMGLMERNLMDEMFEQVKSVYETEVDMVKTEQEETIQRSLASHAIHFQERQKELEESFKARSAALEGTIDDKKRFLWGLARALREQHANMARAMRAVRAHTERLAHKEQSLKSQLTEAEETLKVRCEEMRKQIAKELVLLEENLETMKSERDSLNRERSEIDILKHDSENKIAYTETDENSETKVNNDQNDLKSHYDLLKDELVTLRKYLENSRLEPKCVLERSTITDVSDVNRKIVMNNETEKNGPREEVRPNVVNNLKKQKNVNFSQSNSEVCAGRSSRSRSSSSAGSAEAGHLAEQNERLRRIAQQQSVHISEISAHAARLQAALRERRPRTAPPRFPDTVNASASSNTFGWCKGAGEELCFSLGRTPILVPGDTVPFVGMVGESRFARWHLVDRLRGLRRRTSPLAAAKLIAKPWPGSHRSGSKERPSGRGISMSSPPSTHLGSDDQHEDFSPQASTRDNVRSKMVTIESPKNREKSPKSMLREAKEKLKTVPRSSSTREKSPNQMLREAKLKLRKLEIEAEAVERSYIDFRRRRELRAADAENPNITISANKIEPISILHREERAGHSQSNANDFMKVELDRYLTKYQTNFDIGQTHFRNKNTAAEIKKPIPKDFSDNSELAAALKLDYLEKPLSEFRKLYYTQPVRQPDNLEVTSKQQHLDESNLPHNSENTVKFCKERRAEVKKLKHNKQKELEILQQNINKIYNLQDEPTKEAIEMPFREPKNNANVEDKNLLRVEVESTSEINDLKGKADQNVMLLVHSSVDPREITLTSPDSRNHARASQMTIIVSPKRIDEPTDARNLPVTTRHSPDQEALLTRNVVFDQTFDTTDKRISNEAQLESGNEDSVNEPADYPDDFSADVDNYNIKSEDEHGLSSPLSLPKTSDEDIYWD